MAAPTQISGDKFEDSKISCSFGIAGKTVRLVKEYEKIIDGYIDNNYIIGALLNLEVGIESAFEKIVASMP